MMSIDDLINLNEEKSRAILFKINLKQKILFIQK